MTVSSFRSGNVDEARALAHRAFYEVQMEPARTSSLPFRFGMTFDSAGSIKFGTVNFGCEMRVSADRFDKTYTIAVPMKGVFPFTFKRDDVTAGPTTAVVITPTSELTYRGYPTGLERLFMLTFSEETLQNELRRLLGRDHIGAIALAPSLDVRTGLGAQWRQLASSLALSLATPNGLVTNPMMAASLSSAILTGLLLASDHPYRNDLDAWTRSVPPAVIRRAKDIIESRAHEVLTIPQIADEIGCSVSALQSGYRKHLNMTPREHLGRVRMDRAHSMLKSAHSGSTSVAETAAAWGFRHPGRFAAQYRKTYGVFPSATLREG